MTISTGDLAAIPLDVRLESNLDSNLAEVVAAALQEGALGVIAGAG